jgi:hypothetical protein
MVPLTALGMYSRLNGMRPAQLKENRPQHFNSSAVSACIITTQGRNKSTVHAAAPSLIVAAHVHTFCRASVCVCEIVDRVHNLYLTECVRQYIEGGS